MKVLYKFTYVNKDVAQYLWSNWIFSSRLKLNDEEIERFPFN